MRGRDRILAKGFGRVQDGQNGDTARRSRLGHEGYVRKQRQAKLAILLAAVCLSEIVSPIANSQEENPSTQRLWSTTANSETEPLSAYKNEEFGISFMYPNTYKFKELNTPVEVNANWFPGRIIDRHPGEVQLMSLEIPSELFPGTDLRLAIFSLSANRHLTNDECWAIVSENERIAKKITLDGVQFRWGEGFDAPSAASFEDYVGFSNATCYEIEAAVVTSRFGPPEGIVRVDQAELDRRMDRLLHSLKIHPAKVPQNLPSIRSFTAEILSPPSPPGTYRLKWEVAAASDRQVTIDLNCFADFSMIEVSDLQNGGAAIPCGALKEVSSSKGSLDLSFANHTGVTLYPEIRLLATGREPVSKTVKISLQTMALVRGTTFQGRDLGTSSYIQLYPGLKYVVHGASFSPNETIWIGSTRVPAVSQDGRHLEFAVPASIAGGSVPFYVEDARGKSNVLTARVVRTQPRISFYVSADAPPPESRNMRNTPVVRGQRIRLVGVGFTSSNTVWIGSVSMISQPEERFPQYGLYFTVPGSLGPGTYPLYVTNDLRKSNEIVLTVSVPD